MYRITPSVAVEAILLRVTAHERKLHLVPHVAPDPRGGTFTQGPLRTKLLTRLPIWDRPSGGECLTGGCPGSDGEARARRPPVPEARNSPGRTVCSQRRNP